MAALTGREDAAEQILRVYSAAPGRVNNGLFAFGLAIWFVLGFAVGLRMIHYQLVYLRLYRQIENPNFPVTLEEYSERYSDDPGGWLTRGQFSIWRLWRLVWERQSNPILEAARRRVVRWYWITVAVVMLGMAIPIALSMVGN